VAARFSVQINGCDAIALTHLDIFDGFPSIKICTAYEFNGKTLNYFPSDSAILEKCQPIYEELPGWRGPISEIRHFGELPSEARHYIAKLEKLLSCPINFVSIGPKREQVIKVKPILS
jgi:adenylosuccinate synthase